MESFSGDFTIVIGTTLKDPANYLSWLTMLITFQEKVCLPTFNN